MTGARSIACLSVALTLLVSKEASADGEVTGVLGALIGGDLQALRQGDLSLERSFQNSPLYGARVSVFAYPFGIEGSVVGSPSGLNVSALNGLVGLDARVLYLEANMLLVPIPGPVSPFITAGAGLHSFDFNLNVAGIDGVFRTSVRKLGYSFGGGLRIKVSRIVLRAEARDHITPFVLDDFGLGPIAGVVSGSLKERVHNVEISVAVGVRF